VKGDEIIKVTYILKKYKEADPACQAGKIEAPRSKLRGISDC
jgi:hypothetical protein